MKVGIVACALVLASCGGLVEVSPSEMSDAGTSDAATSDAGTRPARDAATPPDVDAVAPDASDASLPPNPTKVLVSNAQINDFAVDDDWVYWSDASKKVLKAPAQGGAPIVLVSSLHSPGAIAVDATSLYWTTTTFAPDAPTVMKLPFNGGSPITIATCTSVCRDVAVDATHVYWISDDTIMRANLDGTGPQTLAVDTLGPTQIVVHGADLLWTAGVDFMQNHVMRTDLDGTNAKELVKSMHHLVDVAADGANAYVIAGDKLLSVPFQGGAATTRASGAGGGYPGPVAVDATDIYFSWFGGEGFLAMPVGGGPTRHVTQRVNGYYEATNGIIEHGPWLYWLGVSGGSSVAINVTPK